MHSCVQCNKPFHPSKIEVWRWRYQRLMRKSSEESAKANDINTPSSLPVLNVEKDHLCPFKWESFNFCLFFPQFNNVMLS